ncbi:hypothetical protein EX895_003520 [Sporisorium graminicola]|uniref:Vps72/YL1 C-terminal domain-containing protein n=1 Tax=Sporisorium graminicola TaxID=280036 RepID=A0A4U7KTS9_9BASI|nr:hypothetical protein EX895_003520 [Sporisorium graminicola]TKY87506.1 hypothetical protein EX895_003520 [Sporisorium graminicola]
MSRSRSSPTAGPSRSASPASDAAPSSFRVERYDSSTNVSDLMVTSRSKRSTAGNRLKALLDQELEKDEVFAEVENDIDFQANENEDGVDIVDSDFDRDSDDEARGGEDESEGEREIEAQEKADKQKRRAAARTVGIVKRPAAPPPLRAARRPGPPTASVATTEAKRRRISFAPDQPSSSSSPSTVTDQGRRRTSARSATVQSKLEVLSRLEEAEQRRAAQPVKHIVKKKASLTQDALIAAALEVEEENRESLRRFLEQEEERRAKQRQRKERITGPFVRWMSVGLKTKVVEDVKNVTEKGKVQSGGSVVGTVGPVDKKEGIRGEELVLNSVDEVPVESLRTVAPTEGSLKEQQHSASLPISLPDGEQIGEGLIKEANAPGLEQALTPPPLQPAQQEASANVQSKATFAESLDKISSDNIAMADATEQTAQDAGPSAEPLPKEPEHTTGSTSTLPVQQPIEATAVEGARSTSNAAPTTPRTAAAPTSASLTLDPVIAARQQAALLRSSATASSTTLAPSSSTSSRSKYELQARTLLSVERMPEDWEWLDEFNALLGTHCTWDAYPFVPSRNRPLKPRQSICPITGLPAIYKDPRTGIAYANEYAYNVITRLLEGRFVWSGGHYEDRGGAGGGRRGKEKEKERGGKVGVGAVPPEMGIYLDDEREQGPGKVWDAARVAAPTTKHSAATHPTETPPARKKASRLTPSAPTPSASPAAPGVSAAASAAAAAAAEKRKSKPGFDVVLTNALAPGDEKAVLAAALSLPAGSTRSGRRVQRS